ncbi:MAG: hypothetical protein HYY63_05150 [Elusimicrobia bacterium]|nr:hypothetical protein [Elusimicrobiota bacterium]
MMAVQVNLRTGVKPSLRGQILARVRFTRVLNLSEPEFARFVADLEGDPIFRKLVYPHDGGPRAIFRKRFPHSGLSSSFYEVKEENRVGGGTVDVETLLAQHKGLVDLIRKIGRENFETYFLYEEEPRSEEFLAQACGIGIEEVRKIRSLVLEISLHSEFFHPSSIPAHYLHCFTVARIEKDEPGGLNIAYLSPHLARGRYVLNRERIEALKKGMISEEKKKLGEILKKMEWINLRQDTLQKILSEFVQSQEHYLSSREFARVVPMTQRELSRRIGVAASTVCRSIASKSIFLPWGEEKALKDLFWNRREVACVLLKNMLEDLSVQGNKKVKDSFLRDLMFRKHRIKVSRRTINLYRRTIHEK